MIQECHCRWISSRTMSQKNEHYSIWDHQLNNMNYIYGVIKTFLALVQLMKAAFANTTPCQSVHINYTKQQLNPRCNQIFGTSHDKFRI